MRHWFDLQSVVVAVVLLVLVITVQIMCGAYTSEMTLNADEAAHFLSGLMVRDYVLSGFDGAPMDFARNYYSHYPKIGIGNWPPAFYGMQGIWMLLLPASRTSTVVLLALLMWTVAWLVFRATRPTLGAPLAAFAAVCCIMLRPVPAFISVVMTEIPLTFFSVTAVLFWMRFMETEDSKYLVGFGVFSILAIMMKGNGLALALLPPFSIAIGRRWNVLRMPAVWKTGGAVALLTVPWVLYYLPTMRAGWALPDQPIGQFSHPTYYPREFVNVLGVALVIFALFGMFARLRPRSTGEPQHGRLMWQSAFAAILAGVVFHTIAPGGLLDIRHMIPVFPFIAMFVAAGASALAAGAMHVVRNRTLAMTATILFAGAFMLHQALPLAGVPLNGFRAAATEIVSSHAVPQPVVSLISSDVAGEGAMVVEMALKDKARPSHRVWRASKLLASVTWAGRRYRMRAETTDGVLVLLERANVDVIVFDRMESKMPHQRLLERLIAERPDRFQLRATRPTVRGSMRDSAGISIYDFARFRRTSPDSLLRQVPGYDGVSDPLGRDAR